MGSSSRRAGSASPLSTALFALLPVCAGSLHCGEPRAEPADAAPASSAATASSAAASPIAAPPPPSPGTVEATQRLAGSVLVGGHVMDYLRDLTDHFGPRLTGSETCEGAARWAVDQLKHAGIDDARLEAFSIDASWQRGDAHLEVVAPQTRPLHIVPTAWSPPTPAGGIKGELVYMKEVTPEIVRARAAELRGKVVLVDRDAIRKNGRYVLWRSLDPLKDAGIAALLIPQRNMSNVLSAHGSGYKQLTGPFPAASVGREDAAALVRLAEKGPVTLAYTNASALGPAKDVHNVVAEVRGRDKPDEWLLVGAHLDSWDFADGAQDNGTGVATVLEVARAIRAMGAAPSRSIRFALWVGEEQGLLGSRAYVKAHDAELDRAAYVLNTDAGGGAPAGWILDGRDDFKAAFQPLATRELAGLGAATLGTDVRCDTDHCPFHLAGVPTLNLDVDTSHYEEVHHLPSDTIDKVSESWLTGAAAIVAVTAVALAEQPARLAARVDHATVAAHVKKADLTDYLTFSGEWKP